MAPVVTKSATLQKRQFTKTPNSYLPLILLSKQLLRNHLNNTRLGDVQLPDFPVPKAESLAYAYPKYNWEKFNFPKNIYMKIIPEMYRYQEKCLERSGTKENHCCTCILYVCTGTAVCFLYTCTCKYN